MINISAFKSLIPNVNIIKKVPTKTYTNYSKIEIDKEIKNNPYSFLNIITQNKPINKKKKFQNIRNQINKFKEKNIFISNTKKAIYIYRQSKEQTIYTGIICTVSLKDYAEKRIKIHEKTIKKREILFAEYLKHTKLYAEPVLIAHDGNLSQLINPHIEENKLKIHDFSTNDGIQHEIWEITDKKYISKIIQFFQQTSSLYIADGHHRMASSLINHKNGTCLAYIVSKNTLQTYPFHRLVSNIKNTDTIITRINSLFKVKKIKYMNKDSENIQMYISDCWYEINIKNNSKDNVQNLLVSKLLNKILKPVFNIKDERNNKNVTFIPGNQDILKFTKKIKKNEALFLMNTINLNTIIQIANNNQTTPPKSTFILPKLPSGLIMTEIL